MSSIPFASALPVNVKHPVIHAANGSAVFSCACGSGPFLIGSYDTIVTCQGCKAQYQIQEAHMLRTPLGVEVQVRIGRQAQPQ